MAQNSECVKLFELSNELSRETNTHGQKQHCRKDGDSTETTCFITWRSGGGQVVRWSWVNFQRGASYNLDDSRARSYCAFSRCGWGLFGHFYSPLRETARYRLKYCLKGPLNPNQPTNLEIPRAHRLPQTTNATDDNKLS